jgi:adenosylhomocysteine nucleosidase
MGRLRVLVLISANSEWQAVKETLAPVAVLSTNLGEYFDRMLEAGTNGTAIRFFHGGWGKISAATTAQFAIDHWQPDLLINLGTCGGFEGRIARGTIILVTRTIVYDIIEQMSDPDDAVEYYSTEIDLSWLTDKEWLTIDHGQPPVVRGLLVSADRDIIPSDIPMLVEKYGAVAADWESGAIAWVAKRNAVRCLILRGVTDLVSASSGEAYGNITLFHENTKKVMKTMIDQLPGWIDHIRPDHAGQPPLLNKVDCIRLYVPDLESGLVFYRDKLGHDLIWRTPQAAGLRMPGTETEIVIQNEQKGQEVDITVASADEAAQRFADAGGTIVVKPFDIQIGRCTVVRDLWENYLTLLDTSKGLLVTDKEGRVIGNM